MYYNSLIGRSPATLDGYRRICNRIKTHCISKKYLQDVEKKDILSYISYLQQSTKMKAQNINKDLIFLNGTFERALKDELCERNPVKLVDKLPIVEKFTADFYSIEEIKEILYLLENYPNRNVKLVFYFGIFLGLRRGEMVGLKWESVHFEEKSIEILTKIWAQLSEEFKDYDERLVFDIMNEPRVTGDPEEWSGTDEYREVVNNLHKEAVETIRKAGGNNETRFLMLSTYAAKEHKDNVKALVLPDDEYLLVTIHFYYGTAHQSDFLDCENKLTLKDKKEIYDTFRLLYNNFVSKGIGVVNGEFGWTDRENKGNLREKTIYYVATASKFGIPCFVWDNGESFRLFNRETMYREYGFYIQAIVKASGLYE